MKARTASPIRAAAWQRLAQLREELEEVEGVARRLPRARRAGYVIRSNEIKQEIAEIQRTLTLPDENKTELENLS